MKSAFRKDIKLEADRAAEDSLLSVLRVQSSHGILSEEAGRLQGDSKGICWLVDPLDGSFNFFRGIPACAVSIGLWSDSSPLLGVVLDLTTNDLYEGIVGSGARKNSAAISVSEVDHVDQAVICTGFPVNGDFSKEGLSTHVDIIKRFKKVRMFGSAAISLAFVASGLVDAYFEQDICLWDVAAGIALVKAAGGHVDFFSTSQSETLTVYATNGKLGGDAPIRQFMETTRRRC